MPDTNSTDEAVLVVAVAQGDAAAFQQLVQLHLSALSHYVQRMIFNPADSEDLVQEVFVRLWQKADRFDPNKAKLTTWLHQIAHNLCIDWLRKQKPQEHIETIGLESNSDLEHTQDEVWKQQRLKAALTLLPERQRSAIVLCHHQGLSNIEAAAVLDISVDALESLLARARRKLKQLVTEASSS